MLSNCDPRRNEMAATIVHVPIPRNLTSDARVFYVDQLGFDGRYSEFIVRSDGLTRFQMKYCDNIVQINSLDRPSLCSIFLEGDFLQWCKRWVDHQVNIELLMLDPSGYTAVVADPFGNRFEFRGLANQSASEVIDPQQWSFYKRI